MEGTFWASRVMVTGAERPATGTLPSRRPWLARRLARRSRRRTVAVTTRVMARRRARAAKAKRTRRSERRLMGGFAEPCADGGSWESGLVETVRWRSVESSGFSGVEGYIG